MKTPLLVLSIFLAGAGIASAQALSELDRQRTEKMLRESQPAPVRRPDLDRDVTQGIQSRGLRR